MSVQTWQDVVEKEIGRALEGRPTVAKMRMLAAAARRTAKTADALAARVDMAQETRAQLVLELSVNIAGEIVRKAVGR